MFSVGQALPSVYKRGFLYALKQQRTHFLVLDFLRVVSAQNLAENSKSNEICSEFNPNAHNDAIRVGSYWRSNSFTVHEFTLAYIDYISSCT